MATTTKVIQTVIQLRRQTTAYWEENPDFIPMKAEPVVYMDYRTVIGPNNESVVVPGIKIGNGIDTIKDLPFIDFGSGGQQPSSGFEIIYCDKASNTPKDIHFNDITGTLEASDDTLGKIYLVQSVNDENDVYDEYITIKTPDGAFEWERLGGLDANNIVAKKLSHTLTFGNNGAYQFDGSADVIVPTYDGGYTNH